MWNRTLRRSLHNTHHFMHTPDREIRQIIWSYMILSHTHKKAHLYLCNVCFNAGWRPFFYEVWRVTPIWLNINDLNRFILHKAEESLCYGPSWGTKTSSQSDKIIKYNCHRLKYPEASEGNYIMHHIRELSFHENLFSHLNFVVIVRFISNMCYFTENFLSSLTSVPTAAWSCIQLIRSCSDFEWQDDLGPCVSIYMHSDTIPK